MTGLYLHIPYCASKCNYCDFYSAGGSHGVPEIYPDALLRELARFVKNGDVSTFDTLYFGGGTPSLLTPQQVKRLIDAACLAPDAEITLEANPETVTQNLLCDFRAAGVNRISFGVQTAFDASLKRLGRRHTAQQSRDAMRFAQQAGFENISGDLMLALPDYTLAELTATLDLLEQGGCTHISSYLLKIEPQTVFGKRPPANLPDADASADFYLAAVEQLTARGYAQYEISNFAKDNFAGRHNLLYWNCENHLGLGPAAHSCLAGKRFATPSGTAAFVATPTVYEPQGDVTATDYMMLQLRLTAGLSLRALQQNYGVVFDEKQCEFLQTLCKNDMATIENQILRLTPKGMLLQNSILCELL
ncbi:MAG: radical SAM family heme chaperone HemW [Ruthenibacterium sp.]